MNVFFFVCFPPQFSPQMMDDHWNCEKCGLKRNGLLKVLNYVQFNSVFDIQTHQRYILGAFGFFWHTVIFELSSWTPSRFLLLHAKSCGETFQRPIWFHFSPHAPCVFWSQHGSTLLSSSFKQMLGRQSFPIALAKSYTTTSKISHVCN